MNIIKKITNRLSRWVYEPSKILIKSKNYRRDKHYIANKNIARCFEHRPDVKSADDMQILRRIAVSYNKGSTDLASALKLFRPSNEWLPIYENNFKEVIQALKTSDLERLQKIYRNFWREPCSTGLVGLPVDMESNFFSRSKNISLINKVLYLNDSIHRFNLWKNYFGNRFDIGSLESPLIGNPYGYYINEKFIKGCSDYQHYYAIKISDLINEIPGRKVVVEIGAGFGGMAYYLIRESKNTTYIDFDLPENLALTAYYLIKAFPDKKILLYGEGNIDKVNLADFDIILMPSFELDKLQNNTCDLVFNSYSLAEMSPETIEHYVLKSAGLIKNRGWFFHINHTEHSLVSARDFPIPNDFLLIYEKLAEWNLGRNSNMDEYEFLYQKN